MKNVIEKIINDLKNELSEMKAYNAKNGLLVYRAEDIEKFESLIARYEILKNEGCGSNA
jgi:hypothetical protein